MTNNGWLWVALIGIAVLVIFRRTAARVATVVATGSTQTPVSMVPAAPIPTVEIPPTAPLIGGADKCAASGGWWNAAQSRCYCTADGTGHSVNGEWCIGRAGYS